MLQIQNQLNSLLPFKPNTQQIQVLEKLEAFIKDFNNNQFLLLGYAGTGKSSIIFALLKILLQQGKRIALTAPTNKATNVLKTLARENNIFSSPLLQCLTIHQLLGLGIDGEIEQHDFKKVNYSSFLRFDLVILDEGSMVGQKLWNCITDELNNYPNIKLIVLGDPAQLKPVNESIQPALTNSNHCVLTEVSRQNKLNPLSNLISHSRKCIFTKQYFQPINTHSNYHQGAFQIPLKILIEYGLQKYNSHWDLNPDEFRILAYTNKIVQLYNQIFRESRYGKNCKPYLENERLITKRPIFAPNGDVLVPNATEIIIKRVSEANYQGYSCYHLSLIINQDSLQCYALNPLEKERYNFSLNERFSKAKIQKTATAWAKYNQLKNCFAILEPCLCLTIHNSQGSTFTEGAIISLDLKKRLLVGDESETEKLEDYNRLWYVAISRFSQRMMYV
ncbi:ATP-dependent RecD-like DNA helicase [Chroococcus sp. FPU101]|uniref:ATP-dependent DNA helicase n=1 Tax=Chroococcus sp. FPU101 TaxID=1974212 RepID=UPI001A8C2346|nr:AAA family ATPase [Chroococcus sp. FPU101]GFE69091.1 DNA helicase, putative [Chroococcus sp. FPU101]